jgi:hypothetical protein
VVVPTDNVELADGTKKLITSYTMTPPGASPVSYTSSTLSPSSQAVQFDLASGSDVEIDGYIFVPQTRLVINGTVSGYTLKLTGGVAAWSVLLNVTQAPSSASNWFFGVQSEILQRQFTFRATATTGTHVTGSDSAMQLNQDKTYAINYWTVDS